MGDRVVPGGSSVGEGVEVDVARAPVAQEAGHGVAERGRLHAYALVAEVQDDRNEVGVPADEHDDVRVHVERRARHVERHLDVEVAFVRLPRDGADLRLDDEPVIPQLLDPAVHGVVLPWVDRHVGERFLEETPFRRVGEVGE